MRLENYSSHERLADNFVDDDIEAWLSCNPIGSKIARFCPSNLRFYYVVHIVKARGAAHQEPGGVHGAVGEEGPVVGFML